MTTETFTSRNGASLRFFYSQNFLQTTRMDQKCTNDTTFQYNKGMDKNLEWLTQNTEDTKSNKGNLTFPTHTVNVIEL